MGKIIWSGNTVLPAPTSMTVANEIVWTSDTGRTLAAYMVGDPVAEKKTVSWKWEYITESELKIIKNTLVPGYFPVSFHDDGVDVTIEAYRGTLTKEHLGQIAGTYFYKTVSVDVVQR